MDRDKLKLVRYRPVYIRADVPMVTIGMVGFSFNKLCNQYFGEAEYCEFYYDEGQKVVAIKLVDQPTENAKIIGRREKSRSSTGPFISGAHFLKETKAMIFIGLLKPNVKSKRYIIEWDEMERMIIIDLKKAL